MIEPFYSDESVVIYHGDSREILPELDVKVDLLLTDPLYGVSVIGAAHVQLGNKGTRKLDLLEHDNDLEYSRQLAFDVLGLSQQKMTKTASAYVWCGHRTFGPITELFAALKYSTRFLVWNKEHPPPSPPGAGWPSGAELCVYAYPKGRTWTPADHEVYTNVLTADSYRHGQPDKSGHPTQKPMKVFRPLVRYSSHPDDLVLDPFMGSGTTLKVCKNEGRRAIGIEIKEEYCETAAKRCSQGHLIGEDDDE